MIYSSYNISLFGGFRKPFIASPPADTKPATLIYDENERFALVFLEKNEKMLKPNPTPT
jgi:hypothetical protein